MRILLFCENKYAIDILRPLEKEARRQGGHMVRWYVHAKKIPQFPLKDEVAWTDSIQEAYDFSPEAIFVPGNIVPYYLPGVKIQIFHGYAAEKKDHWIIRRYFDCYFTQGPYFTSHFQRLARRYGDFEVLETGWTRQDWVSEHRNDFQEERNRLLAAHGRQKIVLYAPTFSPKLTSLPYIKEALCGLVDKKNALLLIKLHPLTKKEWADEYKQLAQEHAHVVFGDDYSLSKYMLMADVLVSDTSSTIYEFLLLDKPVITLRAIAKEIFWKNIEEPEQLLAAWDDVTTKDEERPLRRWVIENYDPYTDGGVAKRMLAGAADYLRRHGVPPYRKLNLWRKYTSIKTFGNIKRG